MLLLILFCEIFVAVFRFPSLSCSFFPSFFPVGTGRLMAAPSSLLSDLVVCWMLLLLSCWIWSFDGGIFVFLLAFFIYSSSLFPPYLFPSALDVSCCVPLSGAAIFLVATRRKLHYGCLRLVFCDLLAFCRSLARVLEVYRNPVTAVSVCLSFSVSLSRLPCIWLIRCSMAWQWFWMIWSMPRATSGWNWKAITPS